MSAPARLCGFAFPFRIDPDTGAVARTEGDAKLRENIRQLLLTNVGERLMLREYGGGARQLLHENINDGLLAVTRHLLTRALLRFEPRVLPTELTIIPRDGELYIRLRYTVVDTAETQTVAIPLRSEG